MKKYLKILVFGAIVLAVIMGILNIEVTTRQGVNFEWHSIKLPLYLKILDFYDRHYNYMLLVKKMTSDSKTEEQKVMKIFEWTYANIKIKPQGYPVIDDHVWHIIVRGYGSDDQLQDVFTTLCNYTNLNAFFYDIYPEGAKVSKPLSFVKLGDKWTIFDAYNGVYFLNGRGQIADINDLSRGDWKVVSIKKNEIVDDYNRYFNKLNSVNFEKWRLSRGAIQSPLRRFIYFIKKPKTGTLENIPRSAP